MNKQRAIFMILLTFSMLTVSAQTTYNQMDANGKRHGVWKKNFKDTKQVRYEGTFNHGIETGLFKFYKLVDKKSVLSATKLFADSSGKAEVTFLTSKGKVISKGFMNGKKYIGEWIYYHHKSDKVMTKEHYNSNGQLDGEKLIYFKNGQLAERVNFLNGDRHGIVQNYSEEGILRKEFNYANGELHGVYKDFDFEGTLIVEGQFKKDKKHGRWKYYKNGKLIKEKNYSDPKTFHKN